MCFGPIHKTSKLTDRKARKPYVCETVECKAPINSGDIYYAEYRGGLDIIRRCAKCFVEGERV